MVRLMVEQMRARHVRCLHVVFTLIVYIGERPGPEGGIQVSEERFNSYIFVRSCAAQVGELNVENLIERWSQTFAALEQAQPSSITKKNVIQQPMNTSKRSCTFLPVFGVIQERTFCKKSLVSDAVVPGQQLEMIG